MPLSYTTIIAALREGRLKTHNAFVKHYKSNPSIKYDINKKAHGSYMLIEAITHGSQQTVAFLLKEGAHISVKDSSDMGVRDAARFRDSQNSHLNMSATIKRHLDAQKDVTRKPRNTDTQTKRSRTKAQEHQMKPRRRVAGQTTLKLPNLGTDLQKPSIDHKKRLQRKYSARGKALFAQMGTHTNHTASSTRHRRNHTSFF